MFDKAKSSMVSDHLTYNVGTPKTIVARDVLTKFPEFVKCR